MLKNILVTSLICFTLGSEYAESCTDTITPGSSVTYTTSPSCNILLQGNKSADGIATFSPSGSNWTLNGYIEATGIADVCIDSNTDLVGSIFVNTGSLSVTQGVSIIPGCSTSVSGAIAVLSSSSTGTLVLSGASTSPSGSIFYLGDPTVSSGSPGRISMGISGNSTYKPLGDALLSSIATNSSIVVTNNLTLANDIYIKVFSGSGILLDVSSGATLTLAGTVTTQNEGSSDYLLVNSQGSSTGTVLFSGVPAIGNLKVFAGIVQLNQSPTSSGTLWLDTATLQFGETISLGSSYTIQCGNNSSSYGIIGVTETKIATVDALITTGQLRKVGSGVLVLTNVANSYTGGSSVEGGRLSISNALQLGTGAVYLSNNGALQVTADTTMTKNITVNTLGIIRVSSGSVLTMNGGIITGSGELDVFGIGTLQLVTPTTFSGNLGLSCATLKCSIDNALSSSTDLSMSSGKLFLNDFNLAISSLQASGGVIDLGSGTFTVNNGGKISAPSYIKGSGNFRLAGAGTMDLSTSTNTFTGTMTVGGGTSVIIGSAGNLQNSSSLIIQDGGLATFKAGKVLNFSTPINLESGTASIDVTTATITETGVVSGSGLLDLKGTSGKMIFTAINTFTGGVKITGGTLSISSNGNIPSGETVTFNGGSLAVTSGFSSNLPMVFNSTGLLSISSGQTFTNSGILSGTSGLKISSGGVLALTGVSSTFSGEIEIASGTLQVAGPTNLGTGTGAIFFNSSTTGGSILDVTGSGTFTRSLRGLSGTVLVGTGSSASFSAGTFTGTLLKSGIGTFTLLSATSPIPTIQVDAGQFISDGATLSSSAISIASGSILEFNQASSGTYTGVITGAGSVDIEGSGVLTITSANAYTGSTTLSGSVSISTDAALGTGVLLANGGTLLSTGDVTFSVLRPVTLNGSTTLTLSPGLTTGGERTTIAFEGLISGAGSLVVDGEGTVELFDENNDFTGTVSITSGTLGIPLGTVLGKSVDADAVNFRGGILKALNTLTVSLPMTLTQTARLETNSGVTLSLSGKIVGSAGISYSGDGIIALTNASSTFSGPIDMIGIGTLEINTAGALGNTSSVNMGPGSTFKVSADAITIPKPIALTGLASIPVIFDIGLVGNTPITSTFSGVISGTGALEKRGDGTLVMSGSPSYTGGTYFSVGTVSINLESNLPAVGSLFFKGGTLAITDSLTLSSNMDFNGAAGLFSIPSGKILTASGVLSGANGLSFTGGGVLELTGNNTYLGNTTISSGVLQVASDANLGSGASIILSGGTLQIDGTFTSAKGLETLNGTIQVDGSFVATFTGVMDSSFSAILTKTGTGTIVLTPASQASIPNVTISAGTLSGSTHILESSTISVASGAVLGFSQTGDGTFTGAISGSGALNINASISNAVLTMNTTRNTFTGGTTLTKGILSVTREVALGESGNITGSGGTLRASDTFSLTRAISLTSSTNTAFSAISGKTLTITGLISGPGALVIGEDGVNGTVYLNPSGDNTYTGGTILSSGTLQINQSDSLGSNTNSLTGNGGSLFTNTTITIPQPMSLVSGKVTSVNVQSGTTLTWNGLISGSGGLNKIGSGTLILGSTSNSYLGVLELSSGAVSISAAGNLPGSVSFLGGTLNLLDSMTLTNPMVFTSASGLFSVAAGEIVTASGVLSGDFGLELLTGGGTLALTGSNTYTGNTVITLGALQVGSDANLGLGSSLILNGGTLQIVGSTFSSNKTLSTFKGTIQVDSGVATFTGDMTPASNAIFTKTGAGDLSLEPNGLKTSIPTVNILGGRLIGDTDILATSGIAVSSDARVVFAQTIGGTYTGPGGISAVGITGDGAVDIRGDSGITLTMTATNTQTGGTYLTSGILSIGSSAPLGNVSSPIIFQGGSLRTTASFSIAQPMTLSSTISSASTLGETFSVGAFTGTSEISIDSGKKITWTGSLAGSGTLELTGLGTLYLNPIGDNTNTGGIVLSLGTLQISKSSSLGATSNILTGNGGSLLTDITMTAPQRMTLVEGVVTPITVSGGTLTWDGVISGLGGFNKLGSGILALGAENAFEGGMTITAGTISISLAENLPCGFPLTFDGTGATLSVTDSATLNEPMIFNLGANFIVPVDKVVSLVGTLSGSSGFTLSGGGALLVTSTNTYFGNTEVLSSVLQVFSDANLGQGTSIILDTATLEVLDSGSTFTSLKGFQVLNLATIDVGDNNVTFIGDLSNLSGGLTNDSSVTKRGMGTLALLPGSNSDNLAVLLLNEGTFVGNSYSLANTSITTSDSTEISFSQDVNGTFSGTITGPGAFRMLGTTGSTLTVSKTQSFSGGLFLEGASYSVSSDEALGAAGGGIFGLGGTLQATSSFTTSRNLTFTDNAVTVEVLNGSRTSTLTFASAALVIGDVLTKTGAGNLTFDGTATITTLNIEQGVVTINGVVQESTLSAVSTTFSSSSAESSSDKMRGTVSLPSPAGVFVGPGGFLLGEGVVDHPVILFGGICGGNGIDEGTLTITQNVTMSPGSFMVSRIDPTRCSHIVVDGTFTINSLVSNILVPARGFYAAAETIVVLEATGGIAGQFADISIPPVFFMKAVPDYVNPLDISVTVTPIEIFPEVHGANADAVANALDKVINWNRENVVLDIPLVDTVSNALLPDVLTSLLPLVDFPNKMTNALNQMHPAPLKGMVIAGENASIEVREAISYRLQNELDAKACYVQEGSDCVKSDRLLHFWISGMGNVLTQNSNTYNHSPQVGYQSKLVGFTSGADVHFADYFYAGVAGGYTSSHIEWKQNHGHGDVNTGHGGLYLSFLGEMFYGNLSVLGGWSGYSTTRHINYPGVHETGKSSHGGRELLSHIDTGINLTYGGFTVRPFDSFDYIAGKESSYREEGAGDWNLRIHKSNSIFLRNELGLQFAACLCVKNSKWTLSPKASWIRELRLKGSHYKAEFASASAFPFTVTGYFPSRNLFSPGVMLSGIMLEDKLALNFTYDGEFTGGYSAHRYTAEARFGF